MERALLQRLLKPFADIRPGEAGTALMMFAYAFLAMTSYNIIQPLTRSKLINNLGAENIPWVTLGAGFIIGVLMLGYTRFYSLLPKRWALPITQACMALVMLAFWTLFRTRPGWADGVSVGFYIWGLILGVLVVSQFWTLANGIYDPRQAKRLFGFIGAGVMIGGMTGAGLTSFLIESVGANMLLLWSALTLIACSVLVSAILGKERTASEIAPSIGGTEKGVTLSRAIQLLRQSKQVQLIALVIGFGSIGAALIEQQLNMAVDGLAEDTIGRILALVRLSVSVAALVIQVWVTPRVHQYLGVGFALLMLPTSVGIDGDRDHPDGWALGGGDRQNHGPGSAVLGGQDHARGALPAASVGVAPGSEAAGGRHGRPRLPRSRRHLAAYPDQAVGPAARMATAQLRESSPDRVVVRQFLPRQT